jgi:hypothetical protein
MARWEAAERQLAILVDGYRVRGSGSGRVRKGDVANTTCLYECKHTDKHRFVVNCSLLSKACSDALTVDLDPRVAVALGWGPAAWVIFARSLGDLTESKVLAIDTLGHASPMRQEVLQGYHYVLRTGNTILGTWYGLPIETIPQDRR